MKYTLEDNWTQQGSDYDEFKAIVKTVSDSTYIANMPNYIINRVQDNEFRIVGLTPNTPHDGKKLVFKFDENNTQTKDSIKETGFLVGEIDAKGNVYSYAVSQHSLLTLLQKLRCFADAIMHPKNIFVRNKFLAEELKTEKDKIINCNMIYRTVDNRRKVFAFCSEKYQEIKQIEMTHIIDDILDYKSFGEAICDGYYIDQFFSKISFVYPTYASELGMKYGIDEKNVIPCIMWMTSDTLDCSLKAIAGWKIGGHFVIQDEYVQKHYGDVEDDLSTDILNSLFNEWEKLPQALCNLMGIDIKLNPKYLEKLLKDTEIAKCIGKKRAESFIEDTIASVDPSTPLTAYDLYMELCESLGKMSDDINSTITQDKLSKILGKLPFYSKW